MSRLHRRRFLQHSAAVASLSVASPWILPSWGADKSPSERLNVAIIGVANRGGANLAGVAKENLVALCDVDATYLGKAAQRFPKAKTYADFRRMLAEVEKQIDAVVVSTPDHTHAAPSLMALRMGKHVYCEKPLAHTVQEVRLVTDTARQLKRATQLGTQIHAGDNYRRVVELIQSGLIGSIGEVHVWVSVSYGQAKSRPTETPPVPETLNWDLWIGPAPMRPYHPCYHPHRWRDWWDFGCGGLGDFGCHYMDLPYWALQLKYPTSIAAEGPAVHPEQTSPGLTVRYEFPARSSLPPVKMTWYDGGKEPPQLAEILQRNEVDPKGWRSGVLFVGSKGMVLANYGSRILLPKKQFVGVEPPPKTIPDSVGHHQEWINACQQGTPTTCSFDYSGPLTETVLLGNVAYRAGEKIAWDAQNLKAIGSPQAEAYLHSSYRPGWSL